MSTILILGIIVFSISSLYFLINPKKGFNSSFLVSFVTLISYTIMLQGGFVTDDNYWTRWLFYAISCPLLAFEISSKVGLQTMQKVYNVMLTVIVMVLGTASSLSQGNFKLAFFALSTVAFVLLLLEFYKANSKAMNSLSPYIIFGWCVFPIVFIFSNEGISSLISFQVAAAIYLGLDIFTKIAFYIHHNKIKLSTEV